MRNSFTVITTSDVIKADPSGRAQAAYSVTNTSSRPVRGLATVKAQGTTKREWLSIAGETERDFAAGATENFTVNFAATGASAGKYPFRLDVAAAVNPDEDFTEGQVVNVEVGGATVAPAAKKAFPIWIIFVILGVVLLVGAVILVLVLKSGKPTNEPVVEETPSPVAETTVTATPTPTRETGGFAVVGTTLVANPASHTGPCPVKITFSGSITANGPGTVKYTFIRSDGARDSRDLSLDFTGPGSKTVETTWTLGAADPAFQPFRGSQQIKILSPNEMESERANFELNCQSRPVIGFPTPIIRDHRRITP